MKRSTKITLALVVILGGSLLALVWNWRARQRPPTSQPATATVERRDFTTTVLATGAVKPQVGAEVKVGARLSGKLERLHANIGDRVQEGQLLAELEKDDLEAAVLQRQAEVAVAEAQIAEANARLKLAEQEHHRQTALVTQNITSRAELDAAARDLEVGKATLGLTQRRLDAALATLREAEVKRSYATLTAPIAGVIGSVSTQEGETVAAGFNAPTFVTIIDLKRLQVDAFVDEVDIGKVPHVQTIYARARDPESLIRAEEEIRAVLRDRHRLRGKPDDFTIQNQATLLAAERETSRSITLLIGSVAGISLLVGGVGILAVMLISIRERTGEIGLRRALGARRRDIRMQFLFEAALLAGSGGMVGVVLGSGSASVVSALASWPTLISWPAAVGAFLFSALVGLFFGLYPAARAARLEPIEALRSE